VRGGRERVAGVGSGGQREGRAERAVRAGRKWEVGRGGKGREGSGRRGGEVGAERERLARG